jgi:hypothetical protein
MLGCVAAVIEMVSPSQLSPAVNQMMSIASREPGWLEESLMGGLLPEGRSRSRDRASGDPSVLRVDSKDGIAICLAPVQSPTDRIFPSGIFLHEPEIPFILMSVSWDLPGTCAGVENTLGQRREKDG